MSATSFETGPLLVSDLPPVPALPGFVAAWTTRFVAARDRRALERAIRIADPNEHTDLLAQARRV